MALRNGLTTSFKRARFGLLPLLALVLVACGGGGGDVGGGGTGGGTLSYLLGGSISGLTGSGLELKLSDGTQSIFPVSTAKTFTFPSPLTYGTTYDVVVGAPPLGQACTVAHGSGTISSNVVDVAVTCVAASHSLSGIIQGLKTAGLVLTDGVENLGLAAGATSFAFPTPIAAGHDYWVRVDTQPQGMTCTVAKGTGTLSADVTNVTISCVVESVLYSFDAPSGDGSSVLGDLIRDSQGNLFGTTSGGGANGDGTVFEVSPPSGAQGAWTETILYSFGASNSGDGLQPHAGLVMDTQGNLYGVTSGGGTWASGTVFKLAPPAAPQTAWTETTLWTFGDGGPADGIDPEGGLVLDSQGSLYGTTFFGGAYSGGAIFALTPPATGQTAWTESILYSFGTNGGNDGGESSAAMIQDSQGNFYGTTQYGGSLGGGTVFKLAPPTASQISWTETVLYSFGTNGLMDGYTPWAGLVQDAQGNLFGTTRFNGGLYNYGTVFKLAPPAAGESDWTESIIHAFEGYATGDGDMPGSLGPWRNGLVVDSQGNLYGTTPEGGSYSGQCGSSNGGGIVYKLSAPSGAQTTWTETILYGFLGSTGIPDACNSATGLTWDSDGNLYGASLNGGSNGSGTIFKIVP